MKILTHPQSTEILNPQDLLNFLEFEYGKGNKEFYSLIVTKIKQICTQEEITEILDLLQNRRPGLFAVAVANGLASSKK